MPEVVPPLGPPEKWRTPQGRPENRAALWSERLAALRSSFAAYIGFAAASRSGQKRSKGPLTPFSKDWGSPSKPRQVGPGIASWSDTLQIGGGGTGGGRGRTVSSTLPSPVPGAFAPLRPTTGSVNPNWTP